MQYKRLILYLLLFIGVTYLVFISAWTNLNSNTLTPWLESVLNSNLSRSYRVDIGLATTRLSGLEIKHINVQELATNRTVLNVQFIFFSFDCLEFLLFQEIDYSMELYGGIIEGEMDLFPERAIDFTISDLQINNNPVIRKTNLITSNPTINGEGNFISSEMPEGELKLTVENLSVSGKPQHTNIPFELPETALSLLSGEFVLSGKEANVNLISKGDLSAKLEGTIKVNYVKPVKSEFDLNLTGSFKPEFEAKLGFFRNILVNYKNTTGQVSVSLTGNIQRPIVKKN